MTVLKARRARAALGWVLKAGVLLAIGGADCRSRVAKLTSQVSLVDGRTPEVAVRVVGQPGQPAPGAPVSRSLLVQCPRPGGPDTVTVRWTPPEGATAIAFPDLQPTNPLGPAPYEFAAVPVSDSNDPQAEASLAVAFAAPAPPQPAGGPTFIDCFIAVTPAGNEYSASFEDSVAGTSGVGAVAAADGAAASGTVAAKRAAGGYRWWQAAVTLRPDGDLPLDQALCQDWAGFLQDPAFFLAVRVPAASMSGDSRSAPLPLVVPEPAFAGPRVELRTTEPPAATVFTAALELRPDRLGLAAAVLPAAPGERWMTLGVSPVPPASCPDGLAGAWELYGELALDFGGGDDSCRECVLELYPCYEGSTPPFFFTDAATAAGRVAAESTVQRSDVTCAGPIALRLAADPPLPPITLAETNLRRASPNALVKLAHTLRGWLASGEQTDVTLTVSSARGVPWNLYRDSALQLPIGGPVTISGSAQFDFWAAARLPFGFRGPESVTVTASPAEPLEGSAWAADHLWSGAWTPPPPAVALALESGALYEGAAVRVSGTLPDGDYRLVVVPNGAWAPGDCFAGDAVATIDIAVSENTLPSTVVWPAATTGAFDVLVLSGQCLPAAGVGGAEKALAAGDAQIVTCSDCSEAAGVNVTAAPKPVRKRLPRRP
jgi:hypothetical protein